MKSRIWGLESILIRAFLIFLLCSSVCGYVAAESDRDPYNAYSKLDQFDASRAANVEMIEEVREKIRRDGQTQVWVRLATDWRPDTQAERMFGAGAAAAQRKAVNTIEQRLIDELGRREIAVIRKFSGFIPWTIVHVSNRELNFLLSHPDVAGVRMVREFAPAIDQSTQHINATSSSLDRGAWEFGFDGLGTIVAVLDSGIQRDHAAFNPPSGRLFGEACFSDDSPILIGQSLCPNGEGAQVGPGAAQEGPGAPCDDSVSGCGHGTHVAGIAAADFEPVAGLEMKGVANRARILPIQVFRRYPSWHGSCDSDPCIRVIGSDLSAALQHVDGLVQAGANVAAINLSLGFSPRDSWCLDSVSGTTDAIAQLVARDVAVVAGSGNEGLADQLGYPACLASTIAVAASGRQDDDHYQGNNMAAAVNLFAPGIEIWSAYAFGETDQSIIGLTGTSMATPHVSGAIAILKQQRPNAVVWQDIVPALESSPFTVIDSGFTRPRLDLLSALGHGIEVPQSPRNVGSGAGSYQFQVSAPSGVAWVAKRGSQQAPSEWIEITAGQGNGSGVVEFTVSSNTGSESRSGHIQIFDKTVSVWQAAAGDTPTEDPIASFAVTPSSPVTGTTVNLDGSGSYDPDDFALFYAWELTQAPGGSQASLASSSGEISSFVPDVSGGYTVRLTVSNGAFEDSEVQTFSVAEQDSGGIIVDGEEVYFENVNLGACQLITFDPATVPLEQIYTEFTFAYSQADLVFLIREDEPVEMTDEPPFDCANGYAPDFDADGLFDFWEGGEIFHYDDLYAVPGDEIHFAMFSYDGEGDINVPGYFDVEVGPVDAPSFSPAAGLHTSPINISISGDSDTTLRYTLDGTAPTSSSPVYSGPISVPEDSQVHVRAKAFHPHLEDSTVSDALYVVTGKLEDVVFSHPGGTYSDGISLDLSAEPSSVVRYTLDGSVPTESSPQYAAPIDLDPELESGGDGSVASYEVKARAFRADWEPSDTVTRQFSLTGTLNRPAISPSPGHYIGEQQVVISAPFAQAAVAYTTDGTDPDCASTPLHPGEAQLTLDADLEVRARSCLADWTPSSVVVVDYQYTPEASVTVSISPQEAVDGGAMWRLSTDNVWRESGELANDVPAVPTTVEFSPVSGWLTPLSREIDLDPDAPNSVDAQYVAVVPGDSVFSDRFLPWSGLPTIGLQIEGGAEASVSAGQAVSVEWVTEGADSCDADGEYDLWQGELPSNGTASLPTDDLPAGVSYDLDVVCDNEAGTSRETVVLSIVAP